MTLFSTGMKALLERLGGGCLIVPPGGDRFARTILKITLLLLSLAGLINGDDGGQAPNQDLKGLSLEQLGNIEVTTSSKQPVKVSRTPGAIYVLTQGDIRRSGATSIPEALRLVPGIEVARIDGGKWSIGIRGFASRLSRSVLVVIDGRTVYSPLYAGVFWEVQDTLMEDVERIEVIRGPGATIWGPNAVNGVINIITKKAKDTRGGLVSTGGGNEQRFGDFRYGGGNGANFDYRVYGKAFDRGPEFHPDRQNFDGFQMGQGGFRMDWELKGSDTLTLQGDLYKGAMGESVSVATGPTVPTVTVQQDAELSGGNLLGQWRHVLKDGSDLQLQIYYDRTSRYEANFAEMRDTFDIDFLHHKTLARRHELRWGAGGRFSDGRTPPVIPILVFNPANRTDKLYSAFVQDDIRLLGEEKGLWLTLGSKLVHTDFSGFGVEPSAQLLWTSGGRQTWWASVTRALRTPSDIEETVTVTALLSASPLIVGRFADNGRFVPETLLGYETGYRTLLFSKLSVDIAAFHNRYNNLLSAEIGSPFVETSATPQYIVIPFVPGNGLYGSTSGFEIAPDWRPLARWRLNGSYSYLHMDLKVKPGSRDVSTVRSTEGSSPHHEVTVQSSLDLPGSLEFSQIYRYVSALPAQLVPSYGTADVRLSWRRVRRFDFAVVGQNLLQPHHVEYGGDPRTLVAIKRSIYGAITWRQ